MVENSSATFPKLNSCLQLVSLVMLGKKKDLLDIAVM